MRGRKTPISTFGRSSPIYVLLLGATGAGKSTLVNTLVNHFRAPQELQKRLPLKSELLVAIRTAYLPPNQPEASQASERNVSKRTRPWALCLRVRSHICHGERAGAQQH